MPRRTSKPSTSKLPRSRPRTRAYDQSDAKGSSIDTYDPIPNEWQVRQFDTRPADEYLKIGFAVDDFIDPSDEDAVRDLYILTDTAIEMNGSIADLRGDALFTLNALLASRAREVHTRELYEFGSGFRGHYSAEKRKSLSTHLWRSLMASINGLKMHRVCI